MLLGELRQGMLLPDKEFVINKTFKVRGQDAVLASITMKNGKPRLWLLFRMPQPDTPETAPPQYLTRRQLLERGIKQSRTAFGQGGMLLDDAVIFGHKIRFGAFWGSMVMNKEQDTDECSWYMKLQHFAEKNVDLSVFDSAPLSEIIIFTYEIVDELPVTEMTPTDRDGIILHFSGGVRLQHIGQVFDLPLDGPLPDERQSFYDDIEGVERYFYINRLFRYDIWREVESEAAFAKYRDHLRQQGYGEKYIDLMRKMHLTSVEGMCPRGYDMAVVEYETEDDIHLQFYDPAYLDGEPDKGQGGVQDVIDLNTETGPHGYKRRTCALGPLPKAFEGCLTVELFSALIPTAGETVVI